jgi:hypothetical protein
VEVGRRVRWERVVGGEEGMKPPRPESLREFARVLLKMKARACVKGVEGLVVGHDGAVASEGGRDSDCGEERACKGKHRQHNEFAGWQDFEINLRLHCRERAGFCGREGQRHGGLQSRLLCAATTWSCTVYESCCF